MVVDKWITWGLFGTGGQSIVTSYGAGVTRTIGGLLSIDTEARRRIPVSWSGASSDANDPNAIAGRGWEYRLGVSIGFGGSAAPRGGVREAALHRAGD